MLRFAANLTLLFNELPFLERFAAAKQAGFSAVELQFPYAWPASAIKEQLASQQLELVLHNLPAGNWEQGERGIACIPERTAEFMTGVHTALGYAKELGVSQLNCLVGKTPLHVASNLIEKTLLDNLRYAAHALAEHNIRLLIEPLNTYDVPGFHIHSTQQALAYIDAIHTDNLFVQYDVYHMQRMEGEISGNLEKHFSRIAHVQIADNPGRHEPGTGELNYPYLFQHLQRLGYSGWIGCEYIPSHSTIDSLRWLHTTQMTRLITKNDTCQFIAGNV